MLSVNEVGGMVLKAARGAGIPLGAAEDLAQVAAYLAGIGGNPAIITTALQERPQLPQVTWHPDGPTITAGSGALVAPVIRDAFAMGHDRATLADIAQADLIGATLAADGVAQRWNGRTVLRSDTEVLRPTAAGPVTIPEADWQVWTTLAAKTYVPESDASRMAGAGAGLTDND